MRSGTVEEQHRDKATDPAASARERRRGDADNRASLRVQEKAGFVLAGETALFSRPTGHERAHVNTVLTRASLEFLAA